MSESADEPRATRGSETAVVCDTSPFNLRFLRAAMQKLGFTQTIETRTLDDLVKQSAAHRAQLVVFDPAMQGGAGVDAIEALQRGAPDALLVAFCSDTELTRLVAALGIVTVEKVGIMHLDELIGVVEEKLGRTAAHEAEDIPVADMDTPVWDLVPSLVDPPQPPTTPTK
jgi:DNA-binding NtrC family response regulator